MSNKIVDLKKYKQNQKKNKVIEVDFKNKKATSVKEYSGSKLVNQRVSNKKTSFDDPDGAA